MNINTLSKLNFYIFVPGFAFVNLYTTEIAVEMIKAIIFATLLLVVNALAGTLISKLCKYDHGMTNAFKNSIMFYNSGNIGIPLITLVFSSAPFIINGQTPYLDMALTAQIMILLVQNITTNTIGFFNAGRATMHWKDSIRKIFGMPTVYAIPLALLLKFVPYDLTQHFAWPALTYIKNGLVPIALVTMGVQLSKTAFSFKNKQVYFAVITRLIGGPLLAFLLVPLFGFQGVIAQVMLISSAVPTAVNTALIAVECKNYPDFASQTVMIATLLSAVTLTFVIYLAGVLFPIMG